MSGSPRVLFRLRELKVSSKMGWAWFPELLSKLATHPDPQNLLRKRQAFFSLRVSTQSLHIAFSSNSYTQHPVLFHRTVTLSILGMHGPLCSTVSFPSNSWPWYEESRDSKVHLVITSWNSLIGVLSGVLKISVCPDFWLWYQGEDRNNVEMARAR